MSFASSTFTGSAGTELASVDSNFSKQSGFSSDIAIGANGASATTIAAVSYAVYQHSGTPASADYSVFSDLTWLSGSSVSPQMGVIGRAAAGAGTFYCTLYVKASNQLRLYKCVAGTFTQLGSGYSLTLSNGVAQNHELRMSGSTISVYVGVTQAVQVTSETSITAAGKSGIIMFTSREVGVQDTGRISSFNAEDAGGAATVKRSLLLGVG